jgi:hypothetical protein
MHPRLGRQPSHQTACSAHESEEGWLTVVCRLENVLIWREGEGREGRWGRERDEMRGEERKKERKRERNLPGNYKI